MHKATAALVLGGCTKLYDDMLDLSWSVSPIARSTLEASIIASSTLLAQDDLVFAATMAAALGTSSWVGGVDHPFWWAWTWIALALVVYAWWRHTTHGTEESILGIHHLVLMTLFCTGIFLEPMWYPEETSTRKTYFRLILMGLLILSLGIQWCQIPFYLHLSVFSIAYFGTSLLVRWWSHSLPTPLDARPAMTPETPIPT